jgi:hypothetical protein
MSAYAHAISPAMMTGPPGEDWWTAYEVADFLGVRITTWRSWVSRHKVPHPDARIGATALEARDSHPLGSEQAEEGER